MFVLEFSLRTGVSLRRWILSAFKSVKTEWSISICVCYMHQYDVEWFCCTVVRTWMFKCLNCFSWPIAVCILACWVLDFRIAYGLPFWICGWFTVIFLRDCCFSSVLFYSHVDSSHRLPTLGWYIDIGVSGPLRHITMSLFSTITLVWKGIMEW